MEPNLHIAFTMAGAGHISTKIEITPDHLLRHHVFQGEIDQSYLPTLISQLKELLRLYPIRGGQE
jgi:hypothetical protein